MKKITAILIGLALIFTMSACGTEGGQTSGIGEGDLFTFSTETFQGEAFTSDNVKDAKLVMINLWEPWCGPCVEEMPDLEKIYEEYKDQGLVILGAFFETGQDEDVASILEEAGITYPILRASSEFAGFNTGYVPTTVFLTGEGKLVSSEPYIGSRPYEEWEQIVKELMEGL